MKYLKNELFEGVISKREYVHLYLNDLIDKEGVVLISISEPDVEPFLSEMVEGFVDVLHSQFWDVEQPIEDKYYPLSPEQGKELRAFIELHKDKRFLIHCAAGMSRSAAIAAAVECIVNYDGNTYSYKTGVSGLSEFRRYFPNPTVFKEIMDGHLPRN